MRQIEGSWVRVCSQCGLDVVHKTKEKCRFAENHRKICASCNRSNVGKANARVDNCPMCDETLKASRTAKGQAALEDHAMTHGLTTSELWLLKHGLKTPPQCKCGCSEPVTWTGWWTGYSAFVIGHNARVENDAAKMVRLNAVRESFVFGENVGWSKGLTKRTDERVRLRGVATSIGRKKAFDEGEMTAWSKGLTKDTDERVKSAADKLSKLFADGSIKPWAKGLTKETDVRVSTMALKVSTTHRNKELRKHLDSAKRFSIDEIRELSERSGLIEFIRVEGDYKNYLTPCVLVRCVKCQFDWTEKVRRLETARCFRCDPMGSVAQSQISDWIFSYEPNAVVNDRKVLSGKELDVYVPRTKFAIEYNGLYWHSVTNKSSIYHESKSVSASNSGVSLFHIFEDEWRDKRLIVESMMSHRMGFTRRKLNARDCVVKTLNSKERREFFVNNHIDGDVKTQTAFGLFHDDELVAAISLRKPFHQRYDGVLEVARLCSTLNTNVRGGMSRLTKIAKQHAVDAGFTKLMTYVDSRFGSAVASWTQCGWTLTKVTEPRWWWTNYRDRFNRFKYRAIDGMTEAEVAAKHEVVKIFGCSNMLFMLDI